MSEAKESKLISFLSYTIPILLAVYVMSVGPAVAFVLGSDGRLERPEYANLLVSFYAPLVWAGENNEFVGDTIRAYIEICNGTY